MTAVPINPHADAKALPEQQIDSAQATMPTERKVDAAPTDLRAAQNVSARSIFTRDASTQTEEIKQIETPLVRDDDPFSASISLP